MSHWPPLAARTAKHWPLVDEAVRDEAVARARMAQPPPGRYWVAMLTGRRFRELRPFYWLVPGLGRDDEA